MIECYSKDKVLLHSILCSIQIIQHVAFFSPVLVVVLFLVLLLVLNHNFNLVQFLLLRFLF